MPILYIICVEIKRNSNHIKQNQLGKKIHKKPEEMFLS